MSNPETILNRPVTSQISYEDRFEHYLRELPESDVAQMVTAGRLKNVIEVGKELKLARDAGYYLDRATNPDGSEQAVSAMRFDEEAKLRFGSEEYFKKVGDLLVEFHFLNRTNGYKQRKELQG